MKKILLVIFLLSNNLGCSMHNQKKEEQTHIIDLVESTNIIRHLIAQNKLADVLEDTHDDDIQKFIANFSPAQMALEAEVLAWPQPVLVYFYQSSVPEQVTNLEIIKNIAHHYEDVLKCVIIDGDYLYTIMYDANIVILPTFLLMHNRIELLRIENKVCLEKIIRLLQEHINR
jgi:hypothetical protein